jgi:hypothetical protein
VTEFNQSSDSDSEFCRVLHIGFSKLPLLGILKVNFV